MAGYLIKGKVLFSLLFSKHFTWKNRCRRGLQSQIVHGNQLSHIEKRKKTCLAISLKHNYCTVLNRGSQRFKIKQKLMRLELWIIYNPFLFKIKFILAVSQFKLTTIFFVLHFHQFNELKHIHLNLRRWIHCTNGVLSCFSSSSPPSSDSSWATIQHRNQKAVIPSS